ncbi:unnamed protein product, partial [Prorocentrum cordatum]
ALSGLVDRYTELSKRRVGLELAQQTAAWAHSTKCKPLKTTQFGLHLPCHESFSDTMRTYRELQQKPACTVGASLPLRPASLQPMAAGALAAGVAATQRAAQRQPGRAGSGRGGGAFL